MIYRLLFTFAFFTSWLGLTAQNITTVASLPSTAIAFTVDDASQRALTLTVDFASQGGVFISDLARLVVLDLQRQQPPKFITLDSANWHFYPFDVQLINQHAYVFGYEDLGGQVSNLNASNKIRVFKVNMANWNIDTFELQLPYNLHAAKPIFRNQEWWLLASLKAPHPTLPVPADLLYARRMSANFSLISDTSVTHRQGLDARGAMFQFELLNDSLFYVLCGGCQMQQSTILPPFRVGNPDVAIYDFDLNLQANNILLASANAPNWPLSNDSILEGPDMVLGLVATKNNQYVQFATYRNANQSPVHTNSGNGKMELYLTKTNSQLQPLERHYFGVPGIDESANFTSRQIAQAGDGSIYVAATTNLAASLNYPDSIQSLYIYAVDSQLQQGRAWVWNNESDVYSQQMIAACSGIYILANSTQRGGQAFHLLKIDGTAWASSSSDEVLMQWDFYPNPAQNWIRLKGDQLPDQIVLKEVHGRELYRWIKPESQELALPELPAGLYFLNGSDSQGHHWPAKKLIIK